MKTIRFFLLFLACLLLSRVATIAMGYPHDMFVEYVKAKKVVKPAKTAHPHSTKPCAQNPQLAKWQSFKKQETHPKTSPTSPLYWLYLY